jgi:hypothetical protein
MQNFCLSPGEDSIVQFGYEGNDTSIPMRIKYIGSQVAAHISVTATTGDLTFEQGATTAAAATTTGTNPIIGATAGVIDISNAAVATFHALANVINLYCDWEAWLVDALPDEATEISAGNAMFLSTLTDQSAIGENGFALHADTSLKTAEDFCVGVTLNGPSSKIHNHDRGVIHRIYEIRAHVTFGTATDGIYIYACDDKAGTKEQIGKLALVSNTATTFPAAGTQTIPLYQTENRRIVLKAADTTGTVAVTTLRASVQSIKIRPSIRESKLRGQY